MTEPAGPHDQPEYIPPRVGELFSRFLENAAKQQPAAPLPSLHLDAEATIAWHRERALTYLHQHAFRRYAHATTDHPQVQDWVTRYLLDPAGFDSMLLF